MKIHKVLRLIMGVAVLAAGVLLLERHPLAGVLLFIAGIGVLMLAAINMMRIGGSVKENFLHHGGGAAEKFTPEQHDPRQDENVWDQLTEKQEDRK